MTKEQFDAFVEQFGEEAAKKIKKLGDDLTAELNKRHSEVLAGIMKQEDFETFKNGEIKKLNDRLEEQEKLAETVRKQGGLINELTQKLEAGGGAEKQITLDEFFKGLLPKIKELRQAGAGFMEITSDEMRKAGVKSFGGSLRTKAPAATTVGNSVVAMTAPPGSPYLPGLGGSDLELFDIVQNPNFILNRVDVGRTNQSRLAWINETIMEGAVGTNIAEAGAKPLTQHKFQVEFSIAKKAAAYIILSEEFEDDLPGLATAVRRMLQNDVLRAFDDAIQAAVIAVARPYEITGLDDKVSFPTLFDAMGALLAQVGYYNYVPNTLALNPVTSWEAMMGKDQEGAYLVPPFMSRINNLLVEATKVAVGSGLAGDLSQYKVDIYKDFTLRVGWINDQFINNLFSIVGELRYHNYISDARKKAIVYDQLADVQSQIEKPAA